MIFPRWLLHVYIVTICLKFSWLLRSLSKQLPRFAETIPFRLALELKGPRFKKGPGSKPRSAYSLHPCWPAKKKLFNHVFAFALKKMTKKKEVYIHGGNKSPSPNRCLKASRLSAFIFHRDPQLRSPER